MGVREFVEAFLLSLLRKVALPDVEFVINYRFGVEHCISHIVCLFHKMKPLLFRCSDYPSGAKAVDKPIFSMCGGSDSEDFVLPTYDVMMSVGAVPATSGVAKCVSVRHFGLFYAWRARRFSSASTV